jgi:hypothetical protein
LLLNWKRKGLRIDHPLGALQEWQIEDPKIFSHLRLAFSIASQHARLAPALKDDLVSVALEALVIAVTENVNDLTNYITRTVHTRCTEYLRSEHPTLNSTKDIQRHGEATQVGYLKHDPAGSESNVSELEELIYSVAENPFERDILRMRSMGYDDQEIANERGVSRISIQRTRKILEMRFILLERKLNA